MPAPRQKGQTLVAYLNTQAPKLPVNHALGLAKYYHSVDLLQSQAAAYRAAKNEEQLYVMLLRLAQLVIETIPHHKQCIKNSAQHTRYEKLALSALSELEQLKLVLGTRDIRNPRAYTLRRPAESVQITDTDAIPDIDWQGAAAPPAAGAGAGAAAAAAGAAAAGALSAPPGSLDLGQELEWPPRAASASAAAGSSSAAAAAGAPAASSSGSGATPDWQPVTYSSSYAASQQMLQKHALFGPKGGGQRSLQPQGSNSGSSSGGRSRYPAFDSSPIDSLWANNGKAAQQQQQPGSLPDMGSLSLSQQQQQQRPGPSLDPAAAAAAAGMYPGPSAGPSLGPQEVDVQSMLPCAGQPGGSCAMPPPPGWDSQQQQQALVPLPPVGAPAVAEAAAAAAAGPKRLSKRLDLRDVHISVALMNDFLHYAASNTRRGVESCGILAGRLSAADSRFTVTTLIVPKQKGTSDTVEMLSEEEVWEVESSQELMPMGWIHTHPTQTCFLSSVDIHTQCGYQTMLDEAVAIVMAPSDSSKKCGIFRLTTPAGLEHVQRCALRGFHAACNSEQYELCGHVYLNPGARHEVIDLR